MRYYTSIDSPVDALLLVSDGDALTNLYMEQQRYAQAIQPEWQRDAGPFKRAIEQLRAYFAGELQAFDLPLQPRGTAFQLRVWQALSSIPFGETCTYGELARRIGNANAMRAVGLANGRNPLGIIVPCHRVIGANGTLTGYGGGLPRKQWLLRHEATCRPADQLGNSGPTGRVRVAATNSSAVARG
jgi:methylated-DNA-[protein]-cysteine S-methyltransferase